MCGHSFCLVCIHRLLGEQDVSGVYTCPECRKRFLTRPAPSKNIALSKIAERFHTPQGKNRNAILCTYCDFSAPAVKSCQQCETSMCADHLRKHNETVEHTLLPPMAELSKGRCPVHGKIVEYYCIKDSVCVCVSCRLDGEHTGHQVELLEEASKKKLGPMLEKVTLEHKKAEMRVQSLKERRTKAQGVMATFVANIGSIKEHVEYLEKVVLSEVFKWESKVTQLVSDQIQKLEMMEDELSRKMSHFKELRDMAHPLTVLQDQELDKDLYDPQGALPNDPEFPDLQEDLISSTLHKLLDKVTFAKIQIRKPADILLDVNTAAIGILISNNLKTASKIELNWGCSETPEIIRHCGVLSCSSFSWRHYWQVDTSQSDSWRVGMCYPSINRKKHIGQEKDSWCLRRWRDRYNMLHDGHYINLPYKPSSHKFLIYLDYEAGQLSFYEMGNSMRLLHTFMTTFSEPLHAVLGVFQGSIKIVN
ncbi:tripartite motif-containing protein 14-like [Aquarana catesbeiana]|uniref:tripartite motif-containing protein 14-like n=1 Tax=Aquarana catesbeiana TaxID=8400 RepID=UPI003CCA2582